MKIAQMLLWVDQQKWVSIFQLVYVKVEAVILMWKILFSVIVYNNNLFKLLGEDNLAAHIIYHILILNSA